MDTSTLVLVFIFLLAIAIIYALRGSDKRTIR